MHIRLVKTFKADMGSDQVGLKRSGLPDEELGIWETVGVSYREKEENQAHHPSRTWTN